MKRIPLLAFLLLLFAPVLAQHSNQQMIEDSVIGWYANLTPADKPLKPVVFGGQSFSVRQQEINNLFVQWMQQTYTPVAGIGAFRKNLYAREQNAYPHAYGVYFRAYDVDFKTHDRQGRLKPVEETGVPFQIAANVIFNSSPILYFNTPTQYFFTMQPDGYRDSRFFVTKMQGVDLKKNPNLGSYLTSLNDNWATVYLVPGNKLPIRQLTKGEFLQRAEESLGRQLDQKKAEVRQKFSGDKAQADALAYEQGQIEKYRARIQEVRAKHAATLNQPAVLSEWQPSVESWIGSVDPFELDQFAQELKHTYGVYQFDPAVYAKCLSDQPQWIAFNFPYATKEDGRKKYELCRSLLEHFNYDYVYNYFFNPENVKGRPYRPVNEALLKSTLDGYRSRRYWAKPASPANLPAGVYFRDDFTDNEVGSRPAGWFFSSSGKSSAVAAVKGLPGKWLKLGYNNKLDPTALKKPLPENFTLEYDVATAPFEDSRGASVKLSLSGRNPEHTAFVDVSVTAGDETAFQNNHNFRGQVRLEVGSFPTKRTPMTPPQEGGQVILPLGAFTNKPGKSVVHVKLVKQGSELTLFINDKPVASSKDILTKYGKPCSFCSLTPDVRFTTITWQSQTQDADTVGAYISNVKITRN